MTLSGIHPICAHRVYSRICPYEHPWAGLDMHCTNNPCSTRRFPMVHSGYWPYGLMGLYPYTHLPTSAQPRVGSYISPARMRPPVYTRTRIMRARGRAHAPARGGKPLNRSRNRWFVEDPSRTAQIQGMGPYSVYRLNTPMYSPVFAYVRPYRLYRPYPGYAA